MLRRLVATSSIALAMACASPTLPLPPPEDISALRVDATHVSLTATCNGAPPNVLLTVVNENFKSLLTSSDSTLTDPCGAWAIPSVVASPGDRLTITYEEGEQISQQATVFAP